MLQDHCGEVAAASTHAEQIGVAAGDIASLASQARTLALNARIEAARLIVIVDRLPSRATEITLPVTRRLKLSQLGFAGSFGFALEHGGNFPAHASTRRSGTSGQAITG